MNVYECAYFECVSVFARTCVSVNVCMHVFECLCVFVNICVFVILGLCVHAYL